MLERTVLPLALCFAFFGCSAPSADSDPADTSADELSAAAAAAAVDATAIDNAKSLFDDAIYQGGDGAKYAITYSRLPATLATYEEKSNKRSDEWRDRAYKATVTNAKHKSTRVYLIVSGIDDEGEADTLYDAEGKQLASGDTYRSTLPTW